MTCCAIPIEPDNPPQPWAYFLEDVDALLTHPIEVHCLGGFAVSLCYGVPRSTGDIDYVLVHPDGQQRFLEQVAGRESDLSKKHGIHFQYVTVGNLPENYEERLREIFPGFCATIKLLVLDPYDLALSKLERNSPKDREDVEYLATHVPLDPEKLRKIYQDELRPYLANEDRHDLTLKLWLESFYGWPG